MGRLIRYWCINYLIRRGFFVIGPEVSAMVVSYGTGSFKETEDGGKEYKIYMRPGHKLYAINQTLLVKDHGK